MGIDRGARQFIKWLHTTGTEALWSTTKSARDFIHTARAQVTNLGASISHVKYRRSTTWKHSKEWSFAIKLATGCLPTADQLSYRFPDIFEHWKCAMCERDKETLTHLLTCEDLLKW